MSYSKIGRKPSEKDSCCSDCCAFLIKTTVSITSIALNIILIVAGFSLSIKHGYFSSALKLIAKGGNCNIFTGVLILVALPIGILIASEILTVIVMLLLIVGIFLLVGITKHLFCRSKN